MSHDNRLCILPSEYFDQFFKLKVTKYLFHSFICYVIVQMITSSVSDSSFFSDFSGHSNDLAHYAHIFLEHNITGKRLLMMTQEDIRNLGITTYGHIMELCVSFDQ